MRTLLRSTESGDGDAGGGAPSLPPSHGDGLLADQGHEDFGSMIGAGGEPTEPTPPAAPTQPPATQPPVPGVPQPPPPAAPGTPPSPLGAPPPQPNVSDIIRATVDSTAAAFQRQQATPPTAAPADLSPQEFDAKYGIVRPNEALVNQLFNTTPQQAVAVLDHLFQSNLTAALRMSNDIMEAKIAQLEERYKPIAQSYAEQRQQAANVASEGRFFTAYPNLANEKGLVMEMKDAFIAKVASGQIRFANETEAFAAVANATNAILNRLRPGGAPPLPGAKGTQPANGRTMVTASSAGRTSSGTSAANKPKDIVDEVFGADAR